MSDSLGILEIILICVVVVLWTWGVVDLLKRELSRLAFTKWLTIIIAMPIVGFILYLWLGKQSRRVT
jgi:hypothetical protein